MSKVDAVMFDLDGTLWDSGDAAYESWIEALKKEPDVTHLPTIDDFHGIMGLTPDNIMLKLYPDLDYDRRTELFDTLQVAENIVLAEKGGIHYEGMPEALKELSENCKVSIISNCGKGYIEAYLASMGTADYISDIECAGNTGLPKADNIKLVVERNAYKNPVYVGDTIWDKESADAAGVPFIFCSYGFGDVPEAKYVVNTPAELPKLIAEMDI
ncbi:MAG: HAD family hydrolase [Clostridia bacterium]|nr:HAD family hydrolase [Clostridia bacterium]